MTLHDTVETTKKALLFGTLGLIGIVILVFLFRFGVYLKNTLFPAPPPPIEAAFGKLPEIQFGTPKETGPLTYTLDTLTGTVPHFTDRIKVYEIIPEVPEFYDLPRAKTKAQNVGFIGEPAPILDNVFQWSENSGLQRKLIMNTVTKDFSLTSQYMTFPPVDQAINLGDADSAKITASTFFKTMNSLPPTINDASTSAKLFTLQNGRLVEASSITSAHIIRVDFYHQTVDDLPIYSPDYPDSLIYALIGGGTTSPIVVEAQYIDYDIGQKFSEYPIKSAEAAYAELQAGKGYVASRFGTETNIKITDIHLGYFLGRQTPQYLMPVVVFRGDDGFTAYVPAIPDEFME